MHVYLLSEYSSSLDNNYAESNNQEQQTQIKKKRKWIWNPNEFLFIEKFLLVFFCFETKLYKKLHEEVGGWEESREKFHARLSVYLFSRINYCGERYSSIEILCLFINFFIL